MLDGVVSDKGHDLKTCGRIKTACWLIEKENLGTSDELTGYADTSLLTTTDTLANWSTNDGVGLAVNTKRIEKLGDTVNTFFLGYGT